MQSLRYNSPQGGQPDHGATTRGVPLYDVAIMHRKTTMRSTGTTLVLLLTLHSAMAIDITKLWDYSKPAASETRFRAAMNGASDDDAFILQTQIARTFGLRRQFDTARETLAPLEPRLASASAEAQVRYHLELGRSFASATHPPDNPPANREAARSHFIRAFTLAQAAALDYLAIDALHMMPTVDTEPAQQLAWNERALAYLEQSTQPDAKRWEASLRNNVGYARHLAGDYDEALRQYQLSLAAHERAGNASNVRIAHWMIASTYRAQKRFDEAIAIQLRLEREWAAAGEPDPYVFEELEHLFRATHDTEKANLYQAKLKAATAQ